MSGARETSNRFAVTSHPRGIVIAGMGGGGIAGGVRLLNRTEAMNLAAWLVIRCNETPRAETERVDRDALGELTELVVEIWKRKLDEIPRQ